MVDDLQASPARPSGVRSIKKKIKMLQIVVQTFLGLSGLVEGRIEDLHLSVVSYCTWR
jgi:hypothetical protein